MENMIFGFGLAAMGALAFALYQDLRRSVLDWREMKARESHFRMFLEALKVHNQSTLRKGGIKCVVNNDSKSDGDQ